ncbi:protein translocase subunit SecF [Tistrella mobilis]|uniref:Protein-export membrane protein SecF n=1 Tax=Tistrella mobilis (strain KA081020-065) TaxID=1110502 RepID=I3TKU9_TISMK|nr:protein translocase subunit SecF [Tistrella mobilis]AFK53387.1 Preprotein translocase subunit SecF [Tistrella mobilis KA081020-065]
MFKFSLHPGKTNIDFLRYRIAALVFTALLTVATIGLVVGKGLNFGIDFTGGVLVEVETSGPADLGAMRDALGDGSFGDVSLQNFGADNAVLIRLGQDAGEGDAQGRMVEALRQTLSEKVDPNIQIQRAEFVGPKVGQELIEGAVIAFVVAIAAMMIYVWFRFEWQFGVGAVAALFHDVIMTIGMYAVTGYEFNLTSVAAVLTIIGYSLNDTVVIFDRVRENLRKYRDMTILELLNRALNDTLSRTIMTGFTTLIALFALYFVAGSALAGFTFAMIAGVFIGTYSTIFIAVPILVYLNLQKRQRGRVGTDGNGDGEAEAEVKA